MKKATVTDHALIRWLEREHKLPMDEYRAELAALAQPVADIGAKHAKVGDVWFVMHGAQLTTVVPEKPNSHSAFKNDRGPAPPPREPMPWQARKRKRYNK